MAAGEDPLRGAEEQMVAYEVEAFFALLRKVRARLGDCPEELAYADPDMQTDIAVASAFRQTLAEDPDARTLAEQVVSFLRFHALPAMSTADPRGDERAGEDWSR